MTKKHKKTGIKKHQFSRRSFINTVGLSTAGIFTGKLGLASDRTSQSRHKRSEENSIVAATVADSYDPELMDQKIAYLFEKIGGIDDIIQPGKKIGIKINLTGGSNFANDPNLNGVDIRESTWTHPEVLRAVAQYLLNMDVEGSDIYIVEAIWDWDSYNQFGYQDVQNDLGLNMVNLNEPDPYSDFIEMETGDDHFFYESFKFNQILADIDVFISIPKMKQHYDAAITHSMKNLVGISPLEFYTLPSQQGWRSALHFEGGQIGSHLPRSICDLNLARPVHLAVIDGIKNAEGGEGPWNPTFEPSEYKLLIAGKDPVATDSIATLAMDIDPESPTLQPPSGQICDNYLHLLAQKGIGTNLLSEIDLVGDGSTAILGFGDENYAKDFKNRVKLYQNYPNPFKRSTTIRYFIPDAADVKLDIFSMNGQHVETLIEERKSVGEYSEEWTPSRIPWGPYLYLLTAEGYQITRKMYYKP